MHDFDKFSRRLVSNVIVPIAALTLSPLSDKRLSYGPFGKEVESNINSVKEAAEAGNQLAKNILENMEASPTRSGSRGRSKSRGKRAMSISRTRSRSRRVKIGRYLKRRLSRRGGRRKTYRRRYAQSRNVAKSVGQVSVIGIKEEDASVKRHARYGIVYEYSGSGTVSGASGCHLIQSTMAEQTVLVALMLAVLKQLYKSVGIDVKNVTDNIPTLGLLDAVHPTVDQCIFISYTDASGGQNQFSQTYSSGPGGVTWFGLANTLAGLITSQVSAASNQTVLKWNRIWLTNQPSNSVWLASLDFDGLIMKLDAVSCMTYQNRTNGAEPDNSALDVTNDPLYEVRFYGKGSGPVPSNSPPFGGSLGVTYNVNAYNGFTSFDNGSGVGAPRIPEPGKYSFINTGYGTADVAQPGVVKQSKLKYSLTMKVGEFLKKLKIYLTPGVVTNPDSNFGKFCVLYFRKCIDLLGDGSYTIGFQHHLAYGITCKYKQNGTTIPYIAQVEG